MVFKTTALNHSATSPTEKYKEVTETVKLFGKGFYLHNKTCCPRL